MAAPVNPPRGMRDLLPAEKAKREHALAVIRAVYRSHGFDEIETPALEDYDRLHAGLGGDNEKLSFSVLKRGIGPEELAAAADPSALADLGLRYDLTVPLARFTASNQANLPAVFRALQIGPVWRAERPQKGRYRQFVQCDIDIVGEPGPLAELELIGATAAALTALGLEGASVRINDRRILTRLLSTWGVAEEAGQQALIAIDKLDKIGVSGVVAELGEQGVDTTDLAEAFGALATAAWDLAADPPAWLDLDAYRDLLVLKDALPDVELVFDPTLVRGMGYYTGTIFEIAHPSSTSSLGGGGRYDGMIGRFLGREVPAVGFSIGFERIVDLLPDRISGGGEATVLLHEADVPLGVLLAAKRQVQEAGGRVRLERARKNRRAQLDALAAEGFTRFAHVTADGVGEPRPLG